MAPALVTVVGASRVDDAQPVRFGVRSRKARQTCAELGEDYDAMMAKAAKEAAGPPKFSAAAHLEMLREMGVEDVEARHAESEAQERSLREMYQRFAHHQPTAAAMDPDAAERTRVLVQLAGETGESLAGQELTGAILTGMSLKGIDLAGAFLEAVSLLQPEVTAVPAILMALSVELPGLADLVRATARLALDRVRRNAGALAVDEGEPDVASLSSPVLVEEPEATTGGVSLGGIGGLLCDRFRGRDPSESLREALKGYLSGDRSFDLSAADAVFRELDAQVPASVHFLVAGHTHLQRCLLRKRGASISTPGHGRG